MTRVRSLAALLLIGGLAYCAEPTSGNNSPGFARVAVDAVAPPSLALFAPALIVEQMRVIVGHYADSSQGFDTLATRTVPFRENTNQINVSLEIPVSGTDTVDLVLEYRTAGGTVLFVASSSLVIGPGRTSSPNNLFPSYTGPGFNIGFMSMNGDDTTVTAGSSVQLDVTAFDNSESQVNEFYLTWSTDDPRVPVSPRGLVQTRPGATQQIVVTARTPNGVETSTIITSQGPALMALSPDSVDVRPLEEQVFEVTVGSNFDIGTTWSVGGIDGGNATLGTISENGLYTAPLAAIPNRQTEVCVRDSNDPATKGCAKVRMPASGSDADIVMINDMNLFDNVMMQGAGNLRFVQNLVASTGGGSRSRGTVVWSDRSRQSACVPPEDTNNECGDVAKASFFATIRSAGYTLVSFDSNVSNLTSIPGDVRAIILWMPLTSFTPFEINGLKAFAAQGGRLIFIGEHIDYYGSAGIAVENQLLQDLGGSMTNRGDLIDCLSDAVPDYWVTPSRALRAHPLMNGVTDLRYACASEIRLGSNDKPLFYDQANRKVLGAVAAISLEPLIIQDFARPAVVRGARPNRDSRGRLR